LVPFIGRFLPEKQPETVLGLAETLQARGDNRVKFVMLKD